ncbi:MAG: flagellar basal-body rod protein FlgF, partial [Fimbriimonadales bacterium]
QKAQDVLANNLANLNTTGFKADRPVFQAVYERQIYRWEGNGSAPIGSLSAGALLSTTFTDFQPGALQITGNPLDVAIEGNGFFAIQTPQGVRYTRQGAFQLNAEGTLTTREGYPVLSQQGQPIRVPRAASLVIGEDGTLQANGTPIARLQIVQGELTKSPDGYFVGNATPAPTVRLVSGALEMSNVNMVREMVSMIELIRAYESHQRVVQTHDETLGRAINDLARI